MKMNAREIRRQAQFERQKALDDIAEMHRKRQKQKATKYGDEEIKADIRRASKAADPDCLMSTATSWALIAQDKIAYNNMIDARWA